MARFIGDSQAWQAVYRTVAKDAPEATTPALLRGSIAGLEAGRPTWHEQAEAAVRAKLVDLAKRADDLRQLARSAYEHRRAEVAPKLSELSDRLERLERAFVLVRWFHAIFTFPELRRQIASLAGEPNGAAWTFRREREQCLHEHRRIESDFAGEAARTVQKFQARLDRLTRSATSPEFAGAVAELAVIDELRALPDEYVVLSGLELDLGRHVRFDRGHLRTAQADHVVVGPGGVFVIETKNWSRAFAESRNYFNPFDQLKRARFVCQCIVREAVPEVTVRSAIATAASLPERPTDSFAKVLRPNQLVGYIKCFPKAMSEADVEESTHVLRRYLPSAIQK